ncbi:hypothetical protein ACLESD_35675, partial [Pyxidicoccus sp. 3LFB2]
MTIRVMTLRRSILFLLVFSLAVIPILPGCGSDDVEQTPDAGALSDAGTEPDAGTPSDAGTEPDAGTTPDAGTEPDAGTTPDAGT